MLRTFSSWGNDAAIWVRRIGGQLFFVIFGHTPAPVVLLDGVLIAARAGLLQATGVRFDPLFDFHFYDLDFCRTATQSGLRLGTWPLGITHASSGGGYSSSDWQRNGETYLKKWGE